MIELNKILFPTDFSDTASNAFRYALWFADHYGATINLLHVVYPEASPMDFPSISGQATKDKVIVAKSAVSSFVDLALTQVQAGYQMKNVPNVQSDVQVGIPSSTIAKIALRDKPDLIIMGTQGEHNLLERAFGSVTTNTIRKTEVPVLVVPEEAQWDRIDTIAYATDLQESDPWHIWESTKLLDVFNPLLRIVHIAKSKEEELPLKMEELKSFFSEHSPGLQTTFHSVMANRVHKEMVEFVDTWDADLVIMYRPHRNLFENIFHVSLTKKTALYSEVPVLILRG